MFKKNIYSAKINRKHYEIEKGNINQVTIRERERPTIGADLKTVKRTHLFTIS